jgi:hypothetical protein
VGDVGQAAGHHPPLVHRLPRGLPGRAGQPEGSDVAADVPHGARQPRARRRRAPEAACGAVVRLSRRERADPRRAVHGCESRGRQMARALRAPGHRELTGGAWTRPTPRSRPPTRGLLGRRHPRRHPAPGQGGQGDRCVERCREVPADVPHWSPARACRVPLHEGVDRWDPSPNNVPQTRL